MNKQVRDLAIEAGYEPYTPTEEAFNEFSIDKFAKLIIKDCISTWSAIDNGNLVEGTDYLPKALYKRYGLE